MLQTLMGRHDTPRMQGLRLQELSSPTACGSLSLNTHPDLHPEAQQCPAYQPRLREGNVLFSHLPVPLGHRGPMGGLTLSWALSSTLMLLSEEVTSGPKSTLPAEGTRNCFAPATVTSSVSALPQRQQLWQRRPVRASVSLRAASAPAAGLSPWEQPRRQLAGPGSDRAGRHPATYRT